MSRSISSPKRHCQSQVADNVINWIPNKHPDAIGKRVRMKFEVEKGIEEWYEGMIASYNIFSGKYTVYFPSDGQTEEASFDDNDMEFLD